ncbi:MAG: HAMP domain-containing sensor histidine kinase [Pseudomonadota bacterium]|nr:HAMP domain-containing sensor histidine kinase [Pseudomonadota bacterium]
MIHAFKDWIKARWPRLRLRTIVFATLFVVAALPGLAAMFLRVYENTLVRQTEAELVAQGAALAAAAAVRWPDAGPEPSDPIAYRPEPPTIDLSSSDILDERPASVPTDPADADAVAAAQALAPVLARTKQTTLSSILLLDGYGTLAQPGPGKQLAGLPEVAAARAGRPATVLRRNGAYRATYRFEWLSRAAALRVHHARPVVVNGEVVGVLLLSRSARSLFKGLYADRGKIILGIFLVLLLLLLLTGVLSRGIVRPVEALGRATRDLASGRGSLPDPPKTAAIEIQDLYRDFQRMADAIERRSRYLRDFTHAVSHEFKTPLSGIRGALEILADHGEAMSKEDRRRFLANADADAGRLALLSTRLLELARADLSQGISIGRSDLCEILKRVADAQRYERFDVLIDCANDLPSVSMEEASLDAIVTALIENSRQAGASRIAFHIEAKGGLIRLSAKDDGIGIPAADRNRVFEPFFTTKRASGGSGLGLPIVKSLVEAAGGGLRLEDSEAGAQFSLDLPIA